MGSADGRRRVDTPPPLPRDTSCQRIAEFTERVDPRLIDSADRCLQHALVKGDIARHETALRAHDCRLRKIEEWKAAAKPWITLAASIGAAVAAALLGRYL
uniref:Uncharacterized protein n=1 Tax=viral metagenome TaxID=1070528 RepID=A0A6M3XUV2_9ZZZZ